MADHQSKAPHSRPGTTSQRKARHDAHMASRVKRALDLDNKNALSRCGAKIARDLARYKFSERKALRFNTGTRAPRTCKKLPYHRQGTSLSNVMCPNDDKQGRGSASKRHMDSRHSSQKEVASSYAPCHSPTTSRRRSRRVTTTMAGGHRDFQLKHDRAKQPRICAKVTAKLALLACVSAVLWACLIVRVLGPASSATGMTARDKLDMGQFSGTDRGRFAFAISEDEESLFPGWTALGHHSRFLGQEAFPEQFQSWGEGGDVVINGVDVGPLGAANETVPTADLLLAILSGDTEEGREKRDTLREMYDKYEGWISVGGTDSRGTNKEPLDMSFRVVFVISSDSAPPDGKLVGDILYVNAPDGYRNIVHKVKHMMGLVRHVSFKYLLKADDDTFICVKRVATFLHDQPEASKSKIYAGVPTACNIPTNPNRHVGHVIKDRDDKWYDQRFVHHTLSGLDCYPVYMQGAFYVLAQPLVEHLYRGRQHYDTFVNEDVTIGSWLLGVDRELATIHDFQSSRLWNCVCGGDYILRPIVRQGQVFFHNCKKVSELRRCSERLFRPALAC